MCVLVSAGATLEPEGVLLSVLEGLGFTFVFPAGSFAFALPYDFCAGICLSTFGLGIWVSFFPEGLAYVLLAGLGLVSSAGLGLAVSTALRVFLTKYKFSIKAASRAFNWIFESSPERRRGLSCLSVNHVRKASLDT